MRNCIYTVLLTLIIDELASGMEIGFNEGKIQTNVSLQHDYIKGGDFSNDIDTVRLWSNIELLWDVENLKKVADIELSAYPLIDYNPAKGRYEFNLRKGFAAVRAKDIYIGIGKQPIIWGVARGVNPTNYLLDFQLIEKQVSPELALEGRESIVIETPIKDISIETIFPRSEYLENATRFKTFLWDTDFSLSFHATRERIKIGGDFERDIKGWFGVYGEYAVNTKDTNNDYQFVTGISKVIPYFNRSNIDIEYQQDKLEGREKEDIYNLQLLISPIEEFSILSLISHYSNKEATLSMIRLSYSIWDDTEFLITGIFKDINSSDLEFYPFRHIISARVIYYF